jgi:hypothetical protein
MTVDPRATSPGVFSGKDMARFGQTLPKPPKPPVQPPPGGRVAPGGNTQAAPPGPTGSTQSNTTQPGSLWNMFDPRTAQGFGTWATALRPVTEAVTRWGGIPALMGIYGMLNNNSGWSGLFQKQSSRLPLPELSPLGRLRMPRKYRN